MTGLTASDPEEQALREQWYATLRAKEEGVEGAAGEHERVHARLSRYLWNRVERDIEADRRKHPKARRNQKFEGPQGVNRNLP